MEVTQTAPVAKEMAGYGIKVSGISKTRWIGMGSRTLQGGESKESLNKMDENQ